MVTLISPLAGKPAPRSLLADVPRLVITKNGWFAARPSGAEDIYKIYAESFSGGEHLQRILLEAQAIVDKAIAAP